MTATNRIHIPLLRTIACWFVVVILVGHGLIHILGAAKGLGWAEVAALAAPINPALGLVWLAAAIAIVATGVLIAARKRLWWVAGVAGVLVSQAVIFTSWSDAKTGTLANLLLLAALVYGFLSHGPRSYRAEYRRRVQAALRESLPETDAIVTEEDLTHLPPLVAEYVRRSGAVGRPRVSCLRASIHGRIRASATSRWMTYTGEQVNTYGTAPSRLFWMDATMLGLPVDVLHVLVGRSATMRVKLCSVLPMVNAAGPDMDRAETVTLFNDLCILAPAALINAPVVWQTLDESHARGVFTNGARTVSADLTFRDGDLVDFISDDRMSTTVDGATFTPQPWSTPISDYRSFGSRRVAARGEGRWHPRAPQDQFVYLEYNLDSIAYNPGSSPAHPRDRAHSAATSSTATEGASS